MNVFVKSRTAHTGPWPTGFCVVLSRPEISVVSSACCPQRAAVNITDVKPLLIHVSVRQKSVQRQRRFPSAISSAHHPPVALTLQQKHTVVCVREVRRVHVPDRMIAGDHRRKHCRDFLRGRFGQAVHSDVKSKHLRINITSQQHPRSQ